MSETIIASLVGAGGVFVGALMTLIGLGIQSWLQSRREEKQHIKRKREELYIKVCYVLMEHEKTGRYKEINKHCKDVFNELQAPMLIYASRKIYKEYYKLDSEIWQTYAKIHTKKQAEQFSNEIADKIEAFAEKMRKELGIKGA